MIPINGFFEFGIMAILGAIGMVGFGIWALVSNENRYRKVVSLKSNLKKSDSDYPQLKKAA